ncbi:MAG: NADH-quinone oxidoreductase subunit H [Phycisphaerae bacterium]|nr:NADH-quinone oxidoreductase subunit H [Phycisphaerae bacterium]
MASALFYILIFPGFLFVSVFGLAAEYIDRKLCAKLQNRVGPPWFQPLADLVKLVAKETVMPVDADLTIFRLMPVVALTAAITALLYIPMWGPQALFSFQGDVIVVLYLLTIPTLTFFLGGWYSRSVFSMIGAARSITQLFAYEIPLFLSILAPALLANTWSLSEMTVFYGQHPRYGLFNFAGFWIALTALLGKLEKVPFDIPEAETEIVAGSFTEYSGRLLAFFRMTINIEMVVGASLLAAVFLPYGLHLGPLVGFVLYLLKVLLVVALLSLSRTVFARLRIDQMIDFCWKYVAPVAFAQLLADLMLKGLLG